MPTTTALSAGNAVSISLAAGSSLSAYGMGTMQIAPPVPVYLDAALRTLSPNEQRIGPFAAAVTVNLTAVAGGSGVSYYTLAPTDVVLPGANAPSGATLTAAQTAATQALVLGAGNPTDLLTGTVQRVTITGALSTTATQAAAASGTYTKARVVWNNNGASPGAAAVTLTGSPFTYTAPADGSLAVSGGTVSSITISRRGATAVSAGVTAGTVALLAGDVVVITYSSAPTVNFLYATPTKLRIAVNADNDVHGLMIGQSAKRRDYEMTMGDGVMLVCGVPITRLTFSADGAVTGGTHSLQVAFGN